MKPAVLRKGCIGSEIIWAAAHFHVMFLDKYEYSCKVFKENSKR